MDVYLRTLLIVPLVLITYWTWHSTLDDVRKDLEIIVDAVALHATMITVAYFIGSSVSFFVDYGTPAVAGATLWQLLALRRRRRN
jgi:hypothetical protein